MAKTRVQRKTRDNSRRTKKKVSFLTTEGITYVDWKNEKLLRKFISDRAKIRARRVTGNNAQQQKLVADAIKLAREMALVPFSSRVTTQRQNKDRDPGAVLPVRRRVPPARLRRALRVRKRPMSGRGGCRSCDGRRCGWRWRGAGVKVVLRADVDGLGRKGDVCDVAAGYARNYLVPKGLALKSSPGTERQAGVMRRSAALRRAADRADAEEIAVRLAPAVLSVSARAASRATSTARWGPLTSWPRSRRR